MKSLFRGLADTNLFLQFFLVFILSSTSVPADAAGYYNLGAMLRGGAPTANSGSLAFIGSTGRAVWNAPVGTMSGSGIQDGMLSGPYGNMWYDGSQYLYISDGGQQDNSRIVKYDLNNGGKMVGWVGTVLTPPTGGASGCTSTTIGSMTPGWCTGGTAKNFATYLIGLTGDSTYIYAVDGWGSSVFRFNASTGAYGGWIGRVGNITGISCTGGTATVGSFSPGWCTGGGSSGSSAPDGSMTLTNGITTDGTYLYVSDGSGQRILKYNASSGAFIGWLGNNSGTYTGSWITSGTAVSGTGDGMVSGPGGIISVGNSPPTLYVADSSNGRINKYNGTTGAFLGWLGSISTTPSSCDNGITPSTGFTNSWCLGGTSAKSSVGDGSLNTPFDLVTDGTSLFVVESNVPNRTLKYNLTTGSFLGWIGTAQGPGFPPTGGAANCTSVAAGGLTPGWCIGGGVIPGGSPSATSPVSGPMQPFGRIYGVTTIQGQLLVSDARLSKIFLFDSNTGALTGWSGTQIRQQHNGWATWQPAESLVQGLDDHSLIRPLGIYNDGTYLYTAQPTPAGGVKRFNSSDGSAQGWIGYIANSTGLTNTTNTGCNTLNYGNYNLRWCSGGLVSPAGGAGLGNSSSVTGDGTYLYVLTNGNAIFKLTVTGGTAPVVGWVGKILTAPTSCSGGSVPAVGSLTNGWCLNGSADTYGAGDGMIYTQSGATPMGAITTDSTYLYLTDSWNHRVSKYKNSDGTFQGWIGNNAGSITTTWVTGGTMWGSSMPGSFLLPTGIAVSSGNLLFTSDFANHYVNVNLAASGSYNYTIGSYGTTDGKFNNPYGVWTDNVYLYVVDNGNARITKFNATFPFAFVGWKGLIGTSPTGGDTGCNGAAVGTFTPGWCTGGTASTKGNSATVGSFAPGSLTGITGDSTYIYVTDKLAGAIIRLNK